MKQQFLNDFSTLIQRRQNFQSDEILNHQPAVIKNIYACDFLEFTAMRGHLHIFRLRRLKCKFIQGSLTMKLWWQNRVRCKVDGPKG